MGILGGFKMAVVGAGRMKTIWVEILLIIYIISIPTSMALRVIYGQRWLTRENNLGRIVGINIAVYCLAKLGF